MKVFIRKKSLLIYDYINAITIILIYYINVVLFYDIK